MLPFSFLSGFYVLLLSGTLVSLESAALTKDIHEIVILGVSWLCSWLKLASHLVLSRGKLINHTLELLAVN